MARTELMFDVALPDGSTTPLIKALTTTDGIGSFWTSMIEGDASQGQRMTLGFPGEEGPAHYDLQTTEVGDDHVTWAYVGGDNPGWAGTTMTFRVVGPSPMGPGQMVSFTHGEFKGEAAQLTPFVTYIWAQIMARLKGYLEEGAARPFFDPS